jgi:hypothetical protein
MPLAMRAAMDSSRPIELSEMKSVVRELAADGSAK